MLFSKGNLAVGAVASKNTADLGLNCIRLNADGSTVAANGKVLMAVGPVDETRIQFPDVGERAKPHGEGVSIPLDLLEKVHKNLPRDKRTVLQHVAMTKTRDPKKVELTTTDLQHTQRIEGFPKPEAFPPWKQLFRKVKGNEGPRVCVNRKDLIDLLNALEDAAPDKGGQNALFIEINPAGTGMVLRCANRETGQRAMGAITAYNVGEQWLPKDKWEKDVFEVTVKKVIGGQS